MIRTNPQLVIVYDSSRGKDLTFDTAYSEEEAARGVIRCVSHHGRRANVRSVLAKNRAA